MEVKSRSLTRTVVWNSLRNWWHVHLKTLQVMALLCIVMDRSGELEIVECCFAAVVGLPTPPVIDGGESTMLQAT